MAAKDRDSFLIERAMENEYIQVRVNLVLKDILVYLINFSQKINYIVMRDLKVTLLKLGMWLRRKL